MKYFSFLIGLFAFFFFLNAQGQSPIFTTSPIVTVNQGQDYFYTVQAINSNGGAISYSSSLPSWLSLGASENAVVTTFAGSFISGFQEGVGANATFNNPAGAVVDVDGNIYVADRFNHRIRKIATNGVVTTFAGAGRAGFQDGIGEQALLNSPSDLVIDDNGDILFVDGGNYVIRKISSNGSVTTILGSGIKGFKDGTGTEVEFGFLSSIDIDSQGNLYALDGDNKAVRKITPEGVVTTFVDDSDTGSPGNPNFSSLSGLAIDGDDNVFIGDYIGRIVRRITPEGIISVIAGSGRRESVDGQGLDASFTLINQLEVDEQGNVLVADDNLVRVISPEGNVTTISIGQTPVGNENLGTFNVYGIALDSEGNIITTSTFRGKILKTFVNGTTTLIAGGAQVPYIDDLRLTSTFNALQSISSDQEGNVFITESNSSTIRKISVDGRVTTIAGSSQSGYQDGTATQAKFSTSLRITASIDGNIYIADQGNYVIRKIDQNGVVTTLAGSGSFGHADGQGTLASFKGLGDIATDNEGNIYVTDVFRVRKITPQGLVSTLAGSDTFGFANGMGSQAQFRQISGIDVDSEGNVYVADSGNFRVRKISSDGNVSTYAGSGTQKSEDGTGTGASFYFPYSIAIGDNGEIYVSDNFQLRVIEQDLSVSTIAGKSTTSANDGIGFDASFSVSLIDMVTDPNGNLLIADYENYLIRKVLFSSPVLKGNAGNNVGIHNVSITATDENGNEAIQSFQIEVIDTEDPVFTSATTANFAENGTGIAYTITATDASLLTYSLGTENDETLFNVDATTGVVTFISVPDFETPSDVNLDNVYVIDVKASDGVNIATQIVTITITDVDEIHPVFTSATAVNFAENGTATAYTITATDASPLAYSLGTENDEALFNVDANTGEVTFKTAPDFENPADADINNSYVLEVLVTDAVNNSASLRVTISVMNADNEVPIFTSIPITEINDNELYEYFVEAVDPDGDELNISSDELPSWLSLLSTKVMVSTYAGIGIQGYQDGPANLARFKYAGTIKVDSQGNLIVAEFGNKVFRKISTDGVVTTLSVYGETNIATSLIPVGMAIDSDDNIYFTEVGKNTIKKISSNGEVTIFAGSNLMGASDGVGVNATFNSPQGLSFDKLGNMYVADTYNHLIRKISQDGRVTTFAGSTQGFSDGLGANAKFSYPIEIAIGVDDDLYISDSDNHRIRKITKTGLVSTIAGTGTIGFENGGKNESQFWSPRAIASDRFGNIYVADANHQIRVIDSNGKTSSFAGSNEFINLSLAGNVDGDGSQARFNNISSLVVDSKGDLFASEEYNHKIRKITKASHKVEGYPRDQIGINVVSLIVKDGNGGSAIQDFTINVNDVTPPVFTSATTVNFAENGTGVSYTITATDASPLTYSLGTENDEALFNVDATTGEVSFKVSPDFEEPTDANTDNAYLIEVKASDGLNTESQHVTITITDVDEVLPVFTSAIAVNFAENGTGTAYAITATDSNTITYSIGAGNDEAFFNIAAGVVTFKNAPDFETKSSYIIQVRASDGLNTASQNLTITITDVDEILPVFTSATAVNFAENGTGTAYIITATDANAITYSLGTGNDEALFNIAAGVVTFKTAPDFEKKSSYIIQVKANDGLNTASQNVTINITDVDEVLPVFTSATAVNFAENGTGTAWTITATDANPITYSLGTGNDENSFNIAAGVVTFKTAPDFETKNSYTIQVRANDGLNTATQNVTITITDVDEILPVFTSATAVNFAENGTGTAYTITATDANAITYSLGTGNDEALFNIAAGVVTFKTAPDFETKSSYIIQVKANDGLNTATQNVTINITDVDEVLPVFTSATAVSFVENGTGAAYTITATDANPITYSLGTGNDVSFFELNNGNVKFKVAPDFETALDANKDNTYVIEVLASDGLNIAKQTVAIIVTDIDEIKPTVVLSTDASATVFTPSIKVSVKFSETVNGLAEADFETLNATISEFKGQRDTYSFLLTSVSDGEISVKLKANAVVDGASNSNEASAVLSRIVEARNERPTEILLDVASINENIAARTLIGLLSAKDVDLNDSHQFKLVSGTGSTNNASFEIIGNKLFKKADVSFDFETTKTQSIRIKTIDVRGGDFEAVISIAILNVAEPSFAISIIDPSTYETSNNALTHGRVKIGASKIRQVKVKNTSPDAVLTVSELKLPTGFTSSETAFNLEIGTEKTLDITFKPESAGLKTGALQVISNAGNKSLSLAALGLINKAPIAVAPEVRVNHKVGERIELRGFDPDGDPIEFVIVEGPSLGTLTATSDAGFYSFVPSALAPEDRHQDQIKFKVVEKGGGLSSNEAILKFGFNVADQKHVLKTLSVSEPTADQMTFTLNFEDKVFNSNYRLTVQYFDIQNGIRTDLLDANKPKSSMTIDGDQAALTFDAAKANHPLLFSASRVPMLITLSSANGNSATEVYFLEGQTGNRGILKAFDSGSSDGNHLVFAGLTSVPENETREVKMFAIELGDFSLANSTIAITKNPLYGTITSPSQVDLKTNVVSWSVNYTSTQEVGSLDSLEFTVTNPERNTVLSAYARIEVIEVPDAPALSLLSNVEINEDETLSIDIKATDLDSELEFSAVSSDGTNVPVSLTNGKLQISPIKDFNGVVNISVSVTEKGVTSPLSDFDDFQLTIVPVNDAPVVSAIQDVTINEDGETIIELSATDVDASIPEFDFQAAVNSPTDVSFTIVGNQMTIKPSADYFGELTFNIKADDRTGTSTSLSRAQSFKLNVLPVNDAPTVTKALSTQTLIEGFPTYGLDLSNFFTDKEKASKDLIYSVTNLSNVTLSITGSVLNISSVAGNTGLQTAQVTVSDGELSVSQSLNFITAASSVDITVANALSDLTLNEDFGTATIDLAGVFSYAINPNAAFNYSLAGNQSLSATISNGKIELQSLADFNGADQLFVTGLVDGKAKLISFKINVGPVNDAPTLVNLINDISVDEDATLSSVILANTFADVDNDVLIYAASYNAAWLIFDPSTRTFSGTPNNDQVGEVEVTVTATDPSGAKAQDVFKIVVSNTNDNPTSISINANSLNENVAVGTLVGSLSSADVDKGDTNFSYTLVTGTGADDNGQFAIVGNQLLTLGNFDFESKASYSIRVRTVDGFEGSFTQAMTILVNNVNESPTDISIDNSQITENSPISSQVGAFVSTDPDTGDTHSYALVVGEGDDNNAFFEISGNKLLTRSELDYETKQSYSIRIKTLDGAGLGFEEVFIVTVVNEAEAILRLEGGESPEITNVGETSNISLVILNDGDGMLNITAVAYPSGFSGQGSLTGIEPGASQTIDVIFTPTEAKTYSGDIVFTYNGGTSIKSVVAVAQLVTSIEEGFIVEEEVTVFPNPAMDEVTIDLTEYNYRAVDLMIITESGVSMYERTKIKTAKHTVNVSNYSQGVFIVLIKSEFGMIRKKLVIAR